MSNTVNQVAPNTVNKLTGDVKTDTSKEFLVAPAVKSNNPHFLSLCEMLYPGKMASQVAWMQQKARPDYSEVALMEQLSMVKISHQKLFLPYQIFS